MPCFLARPILQHSAPPYYMIENNGYWVSLSWADGNHLLP